MISKNKAHLEILEKSNFLVVWDASISESIRLILYDAQTSGGLLIAVDLGESGRLIDALKKRGTLAAHRIGKIIEDPSARIQVLQKEIH